MGEIRYSRDHAEMQQERIHAFLASSYWAEGIPRDLVEKSVANSVVIGAFDGSDQIGFARLITDEATYAYLADVYVEQSHRGRGVAQDMVARLQALPELQSLRHWHLVTRDAQPLYARLGWEPIPHAERHMQRIFNLYGTPPS
ncbi:MAG: GNAT family N-acetyltransferase [Pseudomonadota bacterium]